MKEKHLKIVLHAAAQAELSGRALLLWRPALELYLYFEINVIP